MKLYHHDTNGGCAVSLQLAAQQKYWKNSYQKHQPFSPLNKRDKTNTVEQSPAQVNNRYFLCRRLENEDF